MKLSLASAFLTSPESGWITAQMPTVDGGQNGLHWTWLG